jgi:tetratricopeptide (TPR) repeat protein
MPDKKTCFVVMGFGEKVDFASGRKLNLDATYKYLIKPAVLEAGLDCVRADEIAHSGVIDVPMYKQLLLADVVVADVSTANSNAFYELGVRHALRPYTTVVICEDKFTFPFDINRNKILTYKHLGEDIGASEVDRFKTKLKQHITDILAKAEPDDDSPVYTFLQTLRRFKLPEDLEGYRPGGGAAADMGGAEPAVPDQTHAELMQQVAEAKKRNDFAAAKTLLSTIRMLMKGKNPDKPDDPYIVQQLALVTYKAKHKTPEEEIAALREACDLLYTLNPETSNDTETLGLWGAVHKRLWDRAKDAVALNKAIRSYERGFYLRNDYYNGINFAFLLNLRADNAASRAEVAGDLGATRRIRAEVDAILARVGVEGSASPDDLRPTREGRIGNAASRAEAIADFVQAERVRREVRDICEQEMKDGGPKSDEQKYWVLATWAEALLGVGDEEGARKKFEEACAFIPNPEKDKWMRESTEEQMGKLRALLDKSPLKYVREGGE